MQILPQESNISPPGSLTPYLAALTFMLGTPALHAAITAELKTDAAAEKVVTKSLTISTDDPNAEAPAVDEERAIGRRFIIVGEEHRPGWIAAGPNRRGDGTHTAVVGSDPLTTRHECEQDLKKQVAREVAEYVQWYLGDSAHARQIEFSPAYVEEHLYGDTYFEELQFFDSSLVPMHRMFVRLDFSSDFRGEVSHRWENKVKSARLLQAGFGFAGVVCLLAVAFGFLKTDTATGGAHGIRLKLAAIAVILALLATGVLTARWIPWI